MSKVVPQFSGCRALLTALLLPGLAGAQAPVKSTNAAAVESTTTYTEATVCALWIKTIPAVVGGSSKFTVRVSSNKTGDAAVGLIEQVLGSAGDMWKSSAWIAAVAASNANNQLLTDHEFLLKVRGFIDGPSAGMLMATTMLALINQDPIRPGVSITGTVNPDGTIGPVAGVLEKLEGAKKAGIKELGYPMIDAGNDGSYFKEVEQEGLVKGIKTTPIPDIYAAYEFLTGRKLGRQTPLDEEEMALPSKLVDKYKDATAALIKEARTRIASGEALVPKMSAAEKKRYTSDRDLSVSFIEESEASMKKGEVILAHSRAIMAESSTRMSEKYLQWQQAFAKRDAKALSAFFVAEHEDAEAQLNGMLEKMRPGLEAATLAGRLGGFYDRLQYWSVRAQWLAAQLVRDNIKKRQRSLEQRAGTAPKGAMAALTKESEKISEDMRDAVLRLTILEGRVRAFSDLVGLVFEDNSMPVPDQTARNRRLSDCYGPAAAAGLAYFETTVLGGKAQGSDGAVVEGPGLHNNIAFTSCSQAAEHAIVRDDMADYSQEAVVDRLACGVHAYLGMAALMNQYYNLKPLPALDGSEPAPAPSSVTLIQGKTVERLMESSRKKVLEEAAIVKKQLHFIPDCIKTNFSLGDAKRKEDNDNARLDALTSYWRATFLCKMAQTMAKAK